MTKAVFLVLFDDPNGGDTSQCATRIAVSAIAFGGQKTVI